MAINVASDIVLDVVKAANPLRMKQAAARLGASQGATAAFDLELGKAGRAQGIAPQLTSDIVMDVIAAAHPARSAAAAGKLAGLSGNSGVEVHGLAGLRERLSAGPAQIEPASLTDDRRNVAYRDFEATVLRSFFETMLPGTEGGFYGQGTAGNVWRSMNADYLGQEFAKAGGIGIARQLDGGKNAAGLIAPATQWPYFSQPSIGL